LMAAWVMLRQARAYRGAGITRAFHSIDPALAARMRTAIELDASGSVNASPELVSAHVAAVETAMRTIPEQRVAPVSMLRHPSVLAGVLAVLLVSLFALLDARLRAFAVALVDPAEVRDDGTRVARVVEQLRVRAVYPSYLARDSEELVDPKTISVPHGTKLDIRVASTLPAERGAVVDGVREASLSRAADGSLLGKWTADRNATLRMRITSDGQNYEDPRALALTVQVDKKPSIEVLQPHNGTFVPPDAALPIVVRAQDDVGVSAVDLYLRLPSGDEQHQRIWSALEVGGTRKDLEASAGLVPAELGAREGDTIVIWLSARDDDPLAGPNVTTSPEISIEITSEARQMSAFIPDLQEIADAAVDLLGDRLESDVPDDASAAKARFAGLDATAQAWLTQIDALLTANSSESEKTLHGGGVAPVRERKRIDADAVSELERDTILLADLLAKAHVEEASAIADELRDLKKRIEELIAQVGKTKSPEDERKLMAEIARAQQRLAQLSRSLSRMATSVPSEFVNREALARKEEAKSTLDDLQQAVANHDLESAAAHLEALAKQIDDLASQLGEGGLRLQQERFGPRDKAMAEARQKLDMLAAEQDRLAGRSEQAGGGRDSAGPGGTSESRGLAKQIDSIEQTLGEMDQARRGFEGDRLDRARERLSDAKAALESGDMAEARDMSRAAQRGLSDSASELEAEAGMFPGHRGETSRNAQLARKAADQTRQLSEAISRGMPSSSGSPDPAERKRMSEDAQAQRAARDQAGKLRDTFQNGPDGVPLSPDAVDKLEQAGHAMQEAERALESGTPEEAARAQKQASQELAELSKKLAQQGQKGSQNPQDGAQAGNQNSQAEVKIPGEDEFHGPAQMRRRLLDAMREAPPAGFEAAVQRYYQELLR
jgi:hypothetical protein